MSGFSQAPGWRQFSSGNDQTLATLDLTFPTLARIVWIDIFNANAAVNGDALHALFSNDASFTDIVTYRYAARGYVSNGSAADNASGGSDTKIVLATTMDQGNGSTCTFFAYPRTPANLYRQFKWDAQPTYTTSIYGHGTAQVGANLKQVRFKGSTAGFATISWRGLYIA